MNAKILILGIANIIIPSVLFITIWTFVTSWEYDIECRVNNVTRVFQQTFEPVTCECVTTCRLIDCDELQSQNKAVDQCCSSKRCRRLYQKQLCQVSVAYHTTLHLDLIYDKTNQTTQYTQEILSYESFDNTSYLNQPWPCHYLSSWTDNKQTFIYPKSADNPAWSVVLICIIGIFFIAVWIVVCCVNVDIFQLWLRKVIQEDIV